MRLLDRLVVAVVLAVGCYGLAATPSAPAAADPVCTPMENGGQFCVEVPGLDLIQRPASGMYAMTDQQLTALRSLEADAVQAVRARHGLTDGGDARILTYARSPLRAELLARIVAAADRPAAERTAAEQAALGWLADVQRRQNVASATAALAEYHAFYGDVGPGEHPAHACTYVPPAPYEEEYPGPGGRWPGCYAPPGPLDLGPAIPTFDDFERWGTAASQAAQTNASRSVLSNALARDAIALGSATGIAYAAGATLAAVEVATGGALFNALLPFAAQGFVLSGVTAVPAAAGSFTLTTSVALETAAVTGVETIEIAGASGFSLGLAASVAAVVILALTLAVIATLQVVRSANLKGDLEAALAAAGTTAVDPVALLETDAGRRTLLTSIQSVTLSDGLTPLADSPPLGPSDPILDITDPAGAPLPGKGESFTYTSTALPDDVRRVGTRAFRSGWFVDPAGELDPAISLSMPLWDPDPQGPPGGVTTPRAGFDYDATVTTVMVDGERKWLASAYDRPGYPVFGSPCEDYDTDGCWVTDRLPFYGTATVNDRRWAELVPNVAPDNSITGPTSVPQRAVVTLQALRPGGGDPALDPDGDPVTLDWQVVACPSLFADDCSAPSGHGATQDYTFSTIGPHEIRLTARDSFGRVAVTTHTVQVTNAPPVVTASAMGGPESSAAWVTGVVADGPGEQVGVAVDWGDGTPPSTVQQLNLTGVLSFSLSHDYAESNPDGTPTYPVTITGGDGVLTTVAHQSVPVMNIAPLLELDPLSIDGDIEPGTPVSLSGTASDFGPARLLDLKATWYDGTVQDVAVPTAAGSRPWTAGHLVKKPLAADSGTPLVRLVLTDRNGAHDELAIIGGVVNRAPSFADLTTSDAPVTGDAVALDGLLADPNGDRVTLTVDWDDGGPVETLEREAGAETLALEHVFLRRGLHVVVLEATDDHGLSSSAEVPVVVSGHLPQVSTSSWSVDEVPVDELAEGRPATLVVGLARDPESDRADAIVDWGDETSSILTAPAGTSVLRAAHTYRDDGRYDAVVRVWDADGAAQPLSLATVVRNLPPAPSLRVFDELGRPLADGDAVPVWSRVFAVARADDPGVDDELTGRLVWGDGEVSGTTDARERVRLGHLYRKLSRGIVWRVSDGTDRAEIVSAVRVSGRKAYVRRLAERTDAAPVRHLLSRLPRGDLAALVDLSTCVRLLSGTGSSHLRRSLALTSVATARGAVERAPGRAEARRALGRAEAALAAGRAGAAARHALAAVRALAGSTR